MRTPDGTPRNMPCASAPSHPPAELFHPEARAYRPPTARFRPVSAADEPVTSQHKLQKTIGAPLSSLWCNPLVERPKHPAGPGEDQKALRGHLSCTMALSIPDLMVYYLFPRYSCSLRSLLIAEAPCHGAPTHKAANQHQRESSATLVAHVHAASIGPTPSVRCVGRSACLLPTGPSPGS